ncbi:MAG TPA: malto-oligosyltrehalose trehalohydrolase [Bryobacteraceae bacterium]|nr:malto-oligosyltrehalose trehalohydrolase [Bryobacteraceae bacterium]
MHFRVWAPDHDKVEVRFENQHRVIALSAEANGYFSAYDAEASAGTRYKFSLDGADAYPDPASRFQPTGPHGFSEIVDPHSFAWTDSAWGGVELKGQVIYEMHLGTFTSGGTWRSAVEKLPYLKETGITVIEVMPVADFAGKFGWGYDGVQPYAPASIYGTPDEMRAFINEAHALGLAVILDVVYNHLGPDGNYMPHFSKNYLTDKYKTDWGRAINFDGESSGPVREFFRENAAYWIREFHLDGLRLDATQDIHDSSQPHIITELGEATRAAASPRSILLIGENEPQDTSLIEPVAAGGYGLDGLWNDDFHHTAMVALSGQADAYYCDYRGTPQEFVSALKYGYLYQGQWYRWQKKRRGSSNLGRPRAAMVTFIQNHDQVANSARGQRARELSSPGIYKALTALTLLSPGTPMLFQGQEFGASSPFLYFADHKPELAKLIRLGRTEFLEQWRSLRTPDMKQCMFDPCLKSTFESSKLNFEEVETHAEIYTLHKDLLRLRREDPVFSRQGADGIDGAILTPSAFVMRYFSPGFNNDRLLLVNLGVDTDLLPSPEPLLAAPRGTKWRKLWSSQDAPYGGCGTAEIDVDENWRIPGQAAIVLLPVTIGA